MSQKRKDVVEQLADTICNYVTINASKAAKETALNDKSYRTTILGINRIFIDSVPIDKQEEIIEANAIPEDMTDIDYSYYTINISGTYYVVKSKGEFKLYEEVILRVPNGNWSDMFLEVVKGEDIHIPKIIKSVTEPTSQEYQINIGDYWAQIDAVSTDNIVVFWEYKHNDELGIDEWERMFNVNSGSGSLTVNIEHAIIVQRDDII